MSGVFKTFIVVQLKRAGLNPHTIEGLTTSLRLKEWRVAFTHKSITEQANENYEVQELIGDRIIESIVVSYIYKKLGVVNTGFISKIKTNVVQKKGLASVGLQHGFSEHIRYSEEIAESLKDVPPEEITKTKKYASLIEDTVEAFTGVMMNMIDNVNNIEAGPGYAVAYAWWFSILDELKLSTDYHVVWDPVSRLKEIYDARRRNFGWNFDRNIVRQIKEYKTDPRTGSERPYFTIEYYAYLKGDRTATPQNKVLIGRGTDISIDEAKQTAAKEGLKVLRRYNIIDTPKDPFKRINR